MPEKNLADRLLDLGLGFAAYSEEKVSEFLKVVSARGEARKEDVARFRDEMKARGDDFRREFTRRVGHEVEAALKKLNLASAAEASELRERLAELEEKNARLQEALQELRERLDARS